MPKVRTRLRQNPPAAIVLLCVLHLVLLGADCPARHQPPPSRSTSLPSTPSQSTPSQSTSSRSTASSRVRSGVLRGLVTDEVDAVIVGAVVTARSVNGGERTAQTNRAGVFIFDNLAPGSYAVSAVAGGFATYINSAVEIAPGRRARLNIRLSVTLRGERVRVLSEATVSVEPDGNENAIRLRGSDLEALPFETGDQVDALRALAGPASGPDGAQVYTDGFTGGRVPPRDSIREVRINQNPFSAEYDRLGTNRIEFLTKAGSGKLRGQATFGGMDARLNSRNPFAPNRAPFRSSTGAANLSGPLFKRRSSQASFFVDAERRGTDENGVINARVLDDDLRITPFSLVVLTPQRRTTFSPRVDYQLNERHTFAGRYADTQTSYRNAGVGDFSLPSRAYDTSGTEQVVQLTETAILGARAINETRFQFIRARREERGDNSVPTIRVLDAFTGGGAQVGLAANDDDRWELHNYTTFAAGRHTIRAGGRLRRIRVRDISASNFGGTYTFGGGLAPQLDAANEVVRDERGTVVRGAVSSLERYRRTQLFQRTGRTAADIRALGGGATQFSIAGGDPLAGVGQRDLGLFVQDDWRVRPDLTLSAGLRYEAQTNVGGGLDLAPRVAFAWSPSARANGSSGGKDKQPPRMVVRGGFGVFYERFGENFTLQATRFDGVRQQQFVVTDPRILDLFPGVPSIETLRAFAIR
ncbi:MAG: TonB-dependent receptor, partial [Acidobacteriota bacterium]|nr:TonB-dependent receptor [Acidobacteriota bacterium]